MLLIGHRGCPAYEPENTLRGFERAIAMGVDMLEFDVYALPSGELVVFHDRTLDRTTNGSGLLLHNSFRELRKLDAGKGEKIPTLRETLELIVGRVPVVIEMKNPGASAGVADEIDRAVRSGVWTHDQFIVSSFHHRELYQFKTGHAPHISVVAATSSVPLDDAAYADDLQAVAITPDIDVVDRQLVDDAHRRGLKVYVFTVNNYEDTLAMSALGVDGIFTNVPDVSRQALRAGAGSGLREL